MRVDALTAAGPVRLGPPVYVTSRGIRSRCQEIAFVPIRPHARGAINRIGVVEPDTHAMRMIRPTRENAIRLATWPIGAPVQLETVTGYKRTDGTLDTVPQWYVIRRRHKEPEVFRAVDWAVEVELGPDFASHDVDEKMFAARLAGGDTWPRQEVDGYYPMPRKP